MIYNGEKVAACFKDVKSSFFQKSNEDIPWFMTVDQEWWWEIWIIVYGSETTVLSTGYEPECYAGGEKKPYIAKMDFTHRGDVPGWCCKFFKNGKLYCSINSSAAKTQLFINRESIKKMINAELENDVVEEIILK